ncbi:MAG TPA: hypothetical protein VGU66_06680 [Candidatus Elarobacter sp.]|nr:hypothetical protein [Candidatus Elarobacter sp.]
MIVGVAVPAPRIPRWQRDAVDALRRVPGVDVRVFRCDGVAAHPLGRFTARVAGAVVAPVEIAIDAADAGESDAILDLAGDSRLQARSGVWSFQLGRSNDATLPFAREVMDGDRVVTIALLRRDATAWSVLRRGQCAIAGSYPATLRMILAQIASWPAIVAAAAARGARTAAEPAPQPPAAAPMRGARRAMFPAFVRLRAIALLARSLVVVDRWNAGLADGTARDVLAGKELDVRWLDDPPARTFVADPFLVERDGVRALFVEQYDYHRDRGVIDALVLGAGDRVVATHRILDLATHLSFPHPLEIDGTLYLMPENAAGNEVALYRCVRFPDVWERETALFPAFDGVDMTVFAHGGRWWAFCTRYSYGATDTLFAYHAPSPRGPWAAHALNPIVVDVESARPAGTPFDVDGVLYRSGQDCSRTYGGAITIARVDELTPDTYRETRVRRLEANPAWPYPDGLHTLSFCNGTIALDAKRTYTDLRYLSRIVRVFRRRAERRRAQRAARVSAQPSANERA